MGKKTLFISTVEADCRKMFFDLLLYLFLQTWIPYPSNQMDKIKLSTIDFIFSMIQMVIDNCWSHHHVWIKSDPSVGVEMMHMLI